MPLFNPPTTMTSATMTSSAAPSPQVDGNVWNDSTQKTLMQYVNGMSQPMVATLFTGTADKTITNTTDETSAIPTGVGSLTLPANFLVAGKTLRIIGFGTYTTPAITGGTVTIKIKLGSTVIATVATSALLVGASANAFHFEVGITCRTIGASGSVVCGGSVDYEVASAGRLFDNLDNDGATTTVDTTAQKLLDITCTWDTASTSKIVKTTVAMVQVLN